MIAEIEQSIIERLGADIDGFEPLTRPRGTADGTIVNAPVQIKSFPSNPSSTAIKSLSASGAVLVRYIGSRYGDPRVGKDFFVQDRSMLFEVVCLADSLLPASVSSGIYEMLEGAGNRLIGFHPESAVGVISLVQDDYQSENSGTWEYGIIIAVPSQKRKP